jgi:hypothetical protein
MFEKAQNGQLVRLQIAAPAILKTDAPHNPYATGYGKRIPTQYMVRTIDQKWRRVYCICYSNSGTLYVRHGKNLTIVELPEGQ